jgi:hypothetical protein
VDCKVVLAKDFNTRLFYLLLSISSPWGAGIIVDYGQATSFHVDQLFYNDLQHHMCF